MSEFRLWSFLKADIMRYRALQFGDEHEIWSFYQWFSLFSPRIIPVVLCRLAYFMELHHMSFFAKFLSFLNFVFFGIEISLSTFIDKGLVIPHSNGTVIGASRIGKNAIIFQGVTLGAKFIDFDFNESARPLIGDNVIVGSGAKVLGGISVGEGCKIGANAVVLKSVPPRCMAVGIPSKLINSL